MNIENDEVIVTCPDCNEEVYVCFEDDYEPEYACDGCGKVFLYFEVMIFNTREHGDEWC